MAGDHLTRKEEPIRLPAQDLVILKLDHAKQALAEAKTIQQTKKILDIAGTAEIYAKRQKLGDDAIAYASSIKVGALRRLGELLKETERARPAVGSKIIGSKRVPMKDDRPTLADLGIDKKTSMIAQQLADLPQDQFEQVQDGMASMAQVMRAVKRATTTTITWSLESVEQDLLKAINHGIDHAPCGSHPHRDISHLLRRLADELEQADDPELYEAVSIAKDELDVRDLEPGGYKIFESAEEASTHAGAPNCIASCKSTYQPWYRDLTTHKPGITALRRKQVEARLADIAVGTLPTKRTAQTYWCVVWAIKDLARTSPLGRGGWR